MYPDLLVSIVYQPALMLLNEYVPALLEVSVLAAVPLVTFTPLRMLRETPVTGLLLTASLIVPVIVPEVQLSESIFTVATTSVWLSVASVADMVSFRYPLLLKVRAYVPKVRAWLKFPLSSVVVVTVAVSDFAKLILTSAKVLLLD